MSDEPLSEAKQTLLRALESIEEIEAEMDCRVAHVAVIYSIYKEDEEHTIHDKGGWNHSSAPAWLISALLRQAADQIEDSPVSADPEDD